ncbi:RAD52 motif-containing protein 1 isoform X2 [Heterodontus francisci]|uniref:RAD52 motif-containing protein 1 isoform X2 n=1 Tax=Heterodontus francisci TaxID=7792 RepID=UPI00355BFB8F
MAAIEGSPLQTEIVDFKVPTGNNKTLFVCNILPRESEAEIYDCILKTFSEFGLLYSVRVCRNATVAEPGYYAVIKFYSALKAYRAQNVTNKQCLFQRIPLKLQNISDTDGCDENTQELVQPERKNIKYICIMEVKFINYGMSCRGFGISEAFDQDATDPLNFALKLGRAQKSATQKALSDAFQKILLVVLGNGKVSLQWSLEQDETDCFTEEELQTQLQVNDISWSQFEHEGQEEIL